jgi:hypothetical protein
MLNQRRTLILLVQEVDTFTTLLLEAGEDSSRPADRRNGHT